MTLLLSAGGIPVLSSSLFGKGGAPLAIQRRILSISVALRLQIRAPSPETRDRGYHETITQAFITADVCQALMDY